MKKFLELIIITGLFLVIFIPLYIENNFIYPDVTGKNFAFRIIVDVVFAAWLILALCEAKYRPKISGIVLSFAMLLIVMFFANVFGVDPYSSFWSNLERMDGYITLVYAFLYMLLLSSVLQSKQIWSWLLDISLAIAVLIAFYGLAEFAISESRLVGTLGNAGYLAIYMLFHVFFAIWRFLESKSIGGKIIYASIIPLFSFVLFETGTRGTFIGLVVGVMVMSTYIAIFNQYFFVSRKFVMTASVLLFASAGTFFVLKDINVIKSDERLVRIANISMEDLDDRIIIWGIAWKGIKEKPLLGYGQNNFNYVYNKYYDPRLFEAQWFDRTHNIILEWLIAGGFLGLFAYLSIFAWCAWYLLLRPMLNKEDNSFTTLERGLLLGMLAAYFTQSLVTFDTIINDIFIAITLAFITSRVGAVPEKIYHLKIEPVLLTRFFTPVIIMVLVSVVYFFHLPAMIAAMEMKNAFHETNLLKRLEAYDIALEQHSFADQKITEMLEVLETPKVVGSSILSNKIKQQHYATTEQAIEKLIAEKPDDAQVHLYAGIFYHTTGQHSKAAVQMEQARQLSPLNQNIIRQQGIIALSQYKAQQAHDFFKTAFELDEENLQAREDYAAALLIVQKPKEAIALMDSDEASDRFADSSDLIDTAKRYGHTEFESELFAHRVYAKSNEKYKWNEEPTTWTKLASLYYKLGKKHEALAVLMDARKKLPSVEIIFNCYISSIEANQYPESACQF